MKPGWRQGYSYSYKGAASIDDEAQKYLKYSYVRISASPGFSVLPIIHFIHFNFSILIKFSILMKKETVKKIINLVITILTAIASAFCVQSCRG